MTKLSRNLLIGIPVGLIVILLLLVSMMTAMPRRSGSDSFSAASYATKGMMGDEISDLISKPMGEEARSGLGTVGMDGSIAMPITAGDTAAEVDQKIIKTGSLSIVVDDVSETSQTISTLADNKGGFVQNATTSERTNGTHYGSIIIRVPSHVFEETMMEIKTYATLVKSDSTSGQDVTEQYTDLQAQLRNAQAQEEEYLRILKKAVSVEDILNVQQYLGSIRSQIESLQGRIKYLENVTSYSTISITLTEESTVRLPTKAFRPGSAASEAIQALVIVGQNLVVGLIWIVIVGGGTMLPLALIVWGIVRAVRKARKGKK